MKSDLLRTIRSCSRHLIWVLLMQCSTLTTLSQTPTPYPTSLTPSASAIDILKGDFRSIYDKATEFHRTNVIRKYPVITQDLLNMTLTRTDGTKVRYQMDKKLYFLMAHTSHPPLAIFSALSMDNLDRLSDETVKWLVDYAEHLAAASKEVSTLSIDGQTAERLRRILDGSAEYAKTTARNRKTNNREFLLYVTPLRSLIQQNLQVGAREQLSQFRAKMDAWRVEFPDEKWSEVRVAVLGFHQPRDKYALKLFFRWLLNEPGYENRVIYAEFQDSVFSTKIKREEAEAQAVELLTKVDFDLRASTSVFGAPEVLQTDVMGPATVGILRSWGASSWPSHQKRLRTR